MSEQEFTRALGYANAAFDLLKRSGIPPYPQFYELLFTYATGVNPTLNNRINAIFRSGGSPSTNLAETLYNEFLKSDVNDRMSTVSARMHARIEAVHEAIDGAMTSANAYSGSLQTASGDLARDISPEAMKALAERLLAETRQMQATNSALEQKLEASRDDIASLQRDLDDVRRRLRNDQLAGAGNRHRIACAVALVFHHELAVGVVEHGAAMAVGLGKIEWRIVVSPGACIAVGQGDADCQFALRQQR